MLIYNEFRKSSLFLLFWISSHHHISQFGTNPQILEHSQDTLVWEVCCDLTHLKSFQRDRTMCEYHISANLEFVLCHSVTLFVGINPFTRSFLNNSSIFVCIYAYDTAQYFSRKWFNSSMTPSHYCGSIHSKGCRATQCDKALILIHQNAPVTNNEKHSLWRVF